MSELLHRDALVLNSSWQGIDACSVRDAICNVYADKANFMYTDEGPYQFSLHDMNSWMSLEIKTDEPSILTTSGRIKIPKIIVIKDFYKVPKRKVVFSRRNLWKRDGYRCQYCGNRPVQDEITIDHVIPRCKGGTSTFENCVLACVDCNKRKDNKTPEEAKMRLFRYIRGLNGEMVKEYYHRPTRPKYSPLYAIRKNTIYQEWALVLNQKIDELYWDTQLDP